MNRDRDLRWAEHPVVIVVAPTGAEVTREHNPAVPYTPAEIAADVAACCAAGAAVAHLHVREDDGTPSASAELFRQTVDGIRAACDIVTMVSTGGAMGMTIEERSTGLEARPDMSGIETGSLNFGRDLFPTLPHETEGIAARAAELGIPLEVEAFEIGHIDAAIDFAPARRPARAAAHQHRRRLPGRARRDVAQPRSRPSPRCPRTRPGR